MTVAELQETLKRYPGYMSVQVKASMASVREGLDAEDRSYVFCEIERVELDNSPFFGSCVSLEARGGCHDQTGA